MLQPTVPNQATSRNGDGHATAGVGGVAVAATSRAQSPKNPRQEMTREQKAEKRERDIQQRVERVKKPDSQLIVPRTQEGWMLASLILPFDKAMHSVRRSQTLTFDVIQGMLVKTEGWIAEVKPLLQRLGLGDVEWRLRDPYPDLAERIRVATTVNCMVVNPRVQDTVRLVPLIRGLDEGLIRLRMESQDLIACKPMFEHTADLILRLHDLVAEMSQLGRIPYRATGNLAQLLRHQGREGA